MYFDPETYKVVEQLEKDGELEKAWKILYEEWIQHGDIDYYDDKMYFELLEKMHELYERNPSLIRQRVDLIKEYWRGAAYYAYYVHKNDIEEGLEIVRKANRKDLEEELIDYLEELQKTDTAKDPVMDNQPVKQYKDVSLRNVSELNDSLHYLEGLKISEIASSNSMLKLRTQWKEVSDGERKYLDKQIINDIIEQDFFNVPRNSLEEPDLILEDGDKYELKVSHLFKSRGLIRPKYRLVLKVLNYQDMANNADWKKSALYKKLRQMVIVFYYKDEEKPPWEWIVTSAFVWLSSKYDEKIQRDYTTTRNKVLAGEKISESDTELLANCPKHNSKFCWWCHVGEVCNNPKKRHPAPHPVLDGSLRVHPALGMAERRGYCIPAQYMATLFSEQIGVKLKRIGKSYGVPIENVPYL